MQNSGTWKIMVWKSQRHLVHILRRKLLHGCRVFDLQTQRKEFALESSCCDQATFFPILCAVLSGSSNPGAL